MKFIIAALLSLITVTASASTADQVCANQAVAGMITEILHHSFLTEPYRSQIRQKTVDSATRIVGTYSTGFNSVTQRYSCGGQVSIDPSRGFDRELDIGMQMAFARDWAAVQVAVANKMHGTGNARRYTFPISYTVQASMEDDSIIVHMVGPDELDRTMMVGFYLQYQRVGGAADNGTGLRPVKASGPSKQAPTFLQLDIAHEIDLKNGMYLTKGTRSGATSYVIFDHGHGKFEGGPTANAACSKTYPVNSLPIIYAPAKQYLAGVKEVMASCLEVVSD